MGEEEKKDFEIQDVEGFSGQQDQEFSHQSLVMASLRKCLDCGSKEMKPGYYNESIDAIGSVKRSYVEDARLVFMETVETAIGMMNCDLDDEAKEKIKELKSKLEEKKKDFEEKEEKYWEGLPPKVKMNNWNLGRGYVVGFLSKDLPYYQEYIDRKVIIYREILGELVNLTKRIDFYQSEDLSA